MTIGNDEFSVRHFGLNDVQNRSISDATHPMQHSIFVGYVLPSVAIVVKKQRIDGLRVQPVADRGIIALDRRDLCLDGDALVFAADLKDEIETRLLVRTKKAWIPLPYVWNRGQTEATLQIVPDGNAQYLRFLAGQIDVYSPRPEEVVDLKDKQKQLGITLKEIGIDTGSLFFAFNRNPRHYIHNSVTDPKYRWFTDIRFLRAIAHAVDKQGMINLCFHGLAVPAVSDTSPANKVFYNPNLKDYDYSLKEAGDLLEQAGYHLKNGVRYDPDGHRLEFNLATNSGVNVRDQMCVIFQQDLLRIGIKVNYRPLEFTTLVDKLDSTYDWDVVLIGFTGGIEPNNGADFLRSSGALHLWYPKEPKPSTPWEAEIDHLLEQGTMVMDPLKRAPYYWRIQEILYQQLPIIETVRQVRYEAWKNTLENFQPTVWGNYKPEWIEFRPE